MADLCIGARVAGIVHEQCDGTESSSGFVDGCTDGRVIADIGRSGDGSHTERCNFGYNGCSSLRNEIVHSDAACVVMRQRQRDGATGALSRAGDECDLAAQIEWVVADHLVPLCSADLSLACSTSVSDDGYSSLELRSCDVSKYYGILRITPPC